MFQITTAKRLELINDMANFYQKYGHRYKKVGIEKQIDEWLKKKNRLLELFSQSPYYNDNFQIVVPENWARERDEASIFKFGEWINSLRYYGYTEVKYHGFTYSELVSMVANLECKLAHMSALNLNSIHDYGIMDLIIDLTRYRKYKDYVKNRIIMGRYVGMNGSAYERTSESFDRTVLRDLNFFMCNCQNMHEQILDEDVARWLNNHFPAAHSRKGQKLSRAIRNVAVKYNITKHPDWEREYAKFADACNPLETKKWTVLSLHPIDYLSMSHGNTWSSCATTDYRNVNNISQRDSRSHVTDYVGDGYRFSGSHMSCVQSAMLDETCFIFYTANERHPEEHLERQLKETRQLFYMNNNTMIQSRLYPQSNDDAPNVEERYTKIRNIVQRLISEAGGYNNLWKVRKNIGDVIACADVSGVGCADFMDTRNNKCTISFLGEYPTLVEIGADGICPVCGHRHDRTGSLTCGYC